MVHLKDEVTLTVNAGDCVDVVSHGQGFLSLDARFSTGMGIPIITLVFSLIDQRDIRCFRQGENATVILGVKSGDVYLNGKVLKTELVSTTQHHELKVHIAQGIDFTNDFLAFYHKGPSTEAIQKIMSRYFNVRNEAIVPGDTMSWMGYGIARRIAMNIWFRSYYGGSNFLLVGNDQFGVRMIDVVSAAKSVKWKLGNDPGDDAKIDTIHVENRKPLVQDGLDKDVLSDPIISKVRHVLHKPDPKPFITSEIIKWRKGRRQVMEYQYSIKGPVHGGWSEALAANTGYFSVLRPVVTVSFFHYLPVQVFDGVQLDVRDTYPQLELGGRYIIGPIRITIKDGRFEMILGLLREELVI